MRAALLSIVLVLVTTASSFADVRALASHADDYVFAYYPYGWRGRDARGDIVMAAQTSAYALLLNATRAHIASTRALPVALPADRAAQLSNADVIGPLLPGPLAFSVRIGDREYEAVAAAPKPDAVLIQRLGKYLAHIELREITLRAPDGSALQDATARLHLHAWPDHARVSFVFTADKPLSSVSLVARYTAHSERGLRLVNLRSDGQSQRDDNGFTLIESTPETLARGSDASIAVALAPQFLPPDDDIVVRAEGIAPYTGALPVSYDPVFGWHQIRLGENADIWTTERVRLDIENPADSPRTLRLAFSKRGGAFGITGMSPVLCDDTGAPLGLPVQISKNWHVQPAWFDGVTVLRLEPRARYALEFRLAYAEWGGAPAVSHAQLALEGWGTHQLWDECAIGSFGESITYDPDVNLGRAMIDDVRPLMVWAMGDEPRRKWSWTHNVGGGDFLVLEQDGQRRYLVRQKTDYESQGPVLTAVHYCGETPGGEIKTRITAQSWRSDDYVRGLYTLRYDVIRPLAFSRLAFFQIGADRYNHNLFTTVSLGNRKGHAESWTPRMGGNTYSRDRMPLQGPGPWLALTGSTKNPPPHIKDGDQGAWADRGLIVHHWSARLGGVEAPRPHYSVYGTEDGNVPSAIGELAPPPGLNELLPGDFVHAVVEFVVLPQRADDYYGPNEVFRSAICDHGGTWRLVHRAACAADLRVHAQSGTIESEWPLVVRAHDGSAATFTVQGGSGWLPIMVSGLVRHAPFTLTVVTAPEAGDDAATTIRLRSSASSQSAEAPSPAPPPPPTGTTVSPSDCQVRYRPKSDTYDVTFTINLDSPR